MKEKYIGKICPYCKTEFNSGDDIIVCSVCDMPHHKDCWIQNEGCTTFGCLGTMQYPDSKNTVLLQNDIDLTNEFLSENAVYCSKCGMKNSSGNVFCSSCGNSFNDYQSEYYDNSQSYAFNYSIQQGQRANIDVEKYRAYVEKNSDYYVKAFSSIKNTGKSISWNWIAFLFTPFWFIYRKMYDIGIAIMVVAIFLSNFSTIGYILLIGMYLAMGLYANSIYLKRIDSDIALQRNTFSNQNSTFASKKSGVSIEALTISIIAYFIVSLAVFYIFG